MSSASDRLKKLFGALSAEQQNTLLAFAEFLSQQSGQLQPEIEELAKKDIPRPAEESVVKAIRRLTDTFPMLDTAELLNDAASLMSQHVLQGRAASDVIDELEERFAALYQQQTAIKTEDT